MGIDSTVLLTRRVTLALLLVSGLLIARVDGSPFSPTTYRSVAGENQLWVVDTRGASSNASVQQAARLKYWQCDSGCQWRGATLEQLLSTDDPETTTLIYVHENRVTRSESFQRATTIFRSLTRNVPADQAFRMIAISWPSDRIGILPRPDAQTKARRSEAHGLYLAWLIDQIHPDVPIGMFGMSYGPRLITAALHHLGGGSINGRCLYARVNPIRKPVRVAFGAAALDAHWLKPGQHHGQALTQVDTALILFNPSDKVLRFYPRMFGRGGSPALGYVGLNSRRCSFSGSERIVECNVSGRTGGAHSWNVYEGSPSMMATMVNHLLR